MPRNSSLTTRLRDGFREGVGQGSAWCRRDASPPEPSPHRAGGIGAMTTGGETTEEDELEAQLGTAMEGLQRTVVRLLQDGEVHPHLARIIHQPSRTERDGGDGHSREARAAPWSVRPRELSGLVVLALARVTGEVGAGAALAGGR